VKRLIGVKLAEWLDNEANLEVGNWQAHSRRAAHPIDYLGTRPAAFICDDMFG